MPARLVREAARELPEHQSERGAEFRDTSVEDRYAIARELVLAKNQVENWDTGNEQWAKKPYIRALVSKKASYYYQAAKLGVSKGEADTIWWSFVYDDPSGYMIDKEGFI